MVDKLKRKIWSYEKCLEIAKTCKSIKEFRNTKAYDPVIKNKWSKKIYEEAGIFSERKIKNFWTYEKCLEIAKSCKTLKEFRNSKAYNPSIKNKWRENIYTEVGFDIMDISKNKPPRYWTFEKCLEEASKYETRKIFQIESHGAYNSARKNKWLNQICSHMIIIGNKQKRLIYKFEFTDKSVYIGLTYNSNKRYKEHLISGPVNNHINNICSEFKYEELTDYIDVNIVGELENSYIEEYRERGYNILNSNSGGALGNGTKSKKEITYESCLEKSKICATRKIFYNRYKIYHKESYKNGWLDIFYPSKKKVWDYNSCLEESKKYKFKSHFKLGSNTSYKISKNNGWLNIFYPI